MDKKIFDIYKFPLLISAVLSLVMLGLGTVRLPIEITGVFLGALLGTFVLDSEYLIYAYLIEPNMSFSKTLLGFVKHRDFKNMINYIYYHKDEVEDKSLNSALFQVVIGLCALFVITASKSLFAKALVLSIFTSSIYKLIENYYEGKWEEWFWAFRTKPTKNGVMVYTICLLVFLSICLYVY